MEACRKILNETINQGKNLTGAQSAKTPEFLAGLLTNWIH